VESSQQTPQNADGNTTKAPAKIIAIDGPAASGKSTVAKIVAAALDAVYVDSGSLYRGMTWAVLDERVDPTDPHGVLITMAARTWEFEIREKQMVYSIGGIEPGPSIRSPEVDKSVSAVARIPEVREFITAKLRSLEEFGTIVVEGRDIGSVVFPDTPYKYYLTADPAERAKRAQKRAGDDEVDASEVASMQAKLEQRDEADSTRENAPLQIALGAQVLDTTHLQIEEVAEVILKHIASSQSAG